MNVMMLGNSKLFNPLTLAFMGDAVYEIAARELVIVKLGSTSADRLHTLTVSLVRASAQAEGYRLIEPILTEDEIAMFKRGRNSSSVTVPKSSSAAEYRTATGLETLFGWLHLSGNTIRAKELFSIINKDFFKAIKEVGHD